MNEGWFTPDETQTVLDFARKAVPKMNMTNLKKNRTPDQMLVDIIRGKLAEIAAEIYLKAILGQNIRIDEDLDFNIYERSVWDDMCDLIVEGKRISIKSSSVKAEMLMIETKALREDGIPLYPSKVINGECRKPDIYMFLTIDGAEDVPCNANRPQIARPFMKGAVSSDVFVRGKVLLKKGFPCKAALMNEAFFHPNSIAELIEKNKNILGLENDNWVYPASLMKKEYDIRTLFC